MDWLLHEKECREQGYQLIGGIDEAGRGPLYGPVVAAAVILPLDAEIEGINDSKKLTEKRRETLYDKIVSLALTYGVGVASSREIDEINILNATYLAMMRAYNSLKFFPDIVLVDGNRVPPQLEIPARAIVKGDSKSASIAAASILAKVSRDRLLQQEAIKYPKYGFDRHKGYPTKAHYVAIKEFGILPEHRQSFLKNLAEK